MVALTANLEKFGIKEVARTGKVHSFSTPYCLSILLNCQQPQLVATCSLYLFYLRLEKA